MKKLAIVMMSLASSAFGAHLDQPADTARFINTANCQNCDLSNNENISSLMSLQAENSHNLYFYEGMNVAGSNLIQSAVGGSSYGNELQNANFNNIQGNGLAVALNNLDGATFINASLESANFGYDDLTNADFTGADVTGANFTSAILYGAKITAAQLSSAHLCDTILPDGTNSGCN